MKPLLYLIIWFPLLLGAQTLDSLSLNFEEYIGYVKTNHPIAKQGFLKLEEGDATVTKARGGFDPKLEGDFNYKDYKDKNYYDKLNAKFKIPTWYGVEVLAGYESNDGLFLNPENNVPDDGLFAAGVKVSLGEGLFINKRMADLKKAKAYRNQTKAEQELILNEVIYNASIAYFDWLLNYKNLKIYQRFLTNAELRFNGIKKQVEAGENAQIDAVEAEVNFDNRRLQLLEAELLYNKAVLELSTFLWNDNQPLEVESNVYPETISSPVIDAVLNIATINSQNLDNHPKIRALNFKTESLVIDQKLKANKLLPKLDVQYQFISDSFNEFNTYTNQNYKAKINLAFPIFLRKERGDLKLAKIKLEQINYDTQNTSLILKNKIAAVIFETDSYANQLEVIKNVNTNYEALLTAEERKFFLGESSIFLVNSREKSLIDAQTKYNSVEFKFYNSKAKLFNSLGVIPE
jgi:outer membrane protein TolC